MRGDWRALNQPGVRRQRVCRRVGQGRESHSFDIVLPALDPDAERKRRTAFMLRARGRHTPDDQRTGAGLVASCEADAAGVVSTEGGGTSLAERDQSKLSTCASAHTASLMVVRSKVQGSMASSGSSIAALSDNDATDVVHELEQSASAIADSLTTDHKSLDRRVMAVFEPPDAPASPQNPSHGNAATQLGITPPPSPPPSPPLSVLEQQAQVAHDLADAADSILEQALRDKEENEEEEIAFWEAADSLWEHEWSMGTCPIPPEVRREAATMPARQREDFWRQYEHDNPHIIHVEPDEELRQRWFALPDGWPEDWQY